MGGEMCQATKTIWHQIIEVSSLFESVFFGDFNFPVTSWSNSLKSHMDHDSYKNLLEHGFSQHVNKPTKGDNILDFIYSRNDGVVSNVKLRKILTDTDWVVVENETNVNKSWVKFCNILNGAVKLCIPICKNNTLKWWNS